MSRRAAIALAVWAAAMVAAIAIATTGQHTPPIVDTPPATLAAACDWHTEYRETLAELGEHPRDWVVMSGDIITGSSGLAWPRVGMAAVNAATPCWDVSTTIRHEWMHLQQARAYGPRIAAASGGTRRMEMIADCGAMLLDRGDGSAYPYVIQSIRDNGVGCLPSDLHTAAGLIELREMPT